jgi:RNA polymerase sigma-70 factor (ECF subfamily)
MDVYREAVGCEVLILRAIEGDLEARGRLLELHWSRLIGMVSLRMDRRLASRLDPADIVQQAMIVATRRMDAYLRNPEIPFYPWLYRLTLDRLSWAHSRLGREAVREVAVSDLTGPLTRNIPGDSVLRLAGMAVDGGTSPSGKAIRKDSESLIRGAMDRLSPKLRDVLVMHYVESLTFREIAAILAIGESAVKMRHVRGLEEMRRVLEPSCRGPHR